MRHGFGTAWDPVWELLRALDGGMVMGTIPGGSEDGRVAFAVVPEPTSIALLVLGCVTVGLRRESRIIGMAGRNRRP